MPYNDIVKIQNQTKSITFRCVDSKQRIDNFLFKNLKNIPRSKIYHIIRSGEVRVNKSRVKPRYKVQFNDLIRIPPIFFEKKYKLVNYSRLEKTIKKIKNCIIYEDKYLLGINKPARMVVHGGNSFDFGIIEALRLTYFKNQFLELVHRLDFNTSGILLIAKKSSILKDLHEQIRSKKIKKKYFALVKGNWPKNIKKICLPLLKKNLKNKGRFVLIDEKGKKSETHFKIKKFYFQSTLMRVYPITGRSHQIRVHAKSLLHPIVGDDKYGDFKLNKKAKKLGLKRIFLHASSIKFYHPIIKSTLELKADLTEDLKKYLKKIRKNCNYFF